MNDNDYEVDDEDEDCIWIPVLEWLRRFPPETTLEQFDNAPLMKVRMIRDGQLVKKWWMHLGGYSVK